MARGTASGKGIQPRDQQVLSSHSICPHATWKVNTTTLTSVASFNQLAFVSAFHMHPARQHACDTADDIYDMIGIDYYLQMWSVTVTVK